MKLYLVAVSFFISIAALAEPFTIDDVRNIEKYIESCTTNDGQQKAKGLEAMKKVLNKSIEKKSEAIRKPIKSIDCVENRNISESPLLMMTQESEDKSVIKYKVIFRKNTIINSKTPEVLEQILQIKYVKMSNEDFDTNRFCESKVARLCDSKHKETFKTCSFNIETNHTLFKSCTDKALKDLNQCNEQLLTKICPNLKKSMIEKIVWPPSTDSHLDESKSSNKTSTRQ